MADPVEATACIMDNLQSFLRDSHSWKFEYNKASK